MMCQHHCGLGMEEHLVENFLDIKLMKINKLVDDLSKGNDIHSA